MSYVKSLKKSPFKSLTLTLGKMPDGGIYQNVFVTQDGEPKSASFDCPSYAPVAERKGFLPLVKEALKRAQSMEELTDLLKPPVPVEPPDVSGVSCDMTGEQYEQWAKQCAALRPSVKQSENPLKAQLLRLMQQDDHSQAIEDVLNSGLLPEPQLQQWLDNLVDRAVRRVLGSSGCPEWENWAAKYLSGKDRSAWAAWAAVRAAAWAAARAAEVAAWVAARAAEAAARAAEAAAEAAACAAAEAAVGAAVRAAGWAAGAEERKAQYNDLLNRINEL